MTNKADTKPEPAKTEAKPVEKKEDPAVCALAEKIFIQMCVNARPGWTACHFAAQAHEYAKAFINHKPPVE